MSKVFYETVRGQVETVDFLCRTQTGEMRQLEQSMDRDFAAQQERERQQAAAAREPRREEPQVDEDGWTTVPTRRR